MASIEGASSTGRTDYVYHITLSDRLASLDEGLIPSTNPCVNEDWRALEQQLEETVPVQIASKGISRANAVFAHAERSFIDGIFERNTRSHQKSAAHLVALQVEVDPLEVIVCDAFPINYKMDSNRSAKDYWKTAMTLDEYRRFYGIGISSWFHIAKRDEAPAGLPATIIQPEVLVPGPISPDRIKWFASSSREVSEHKYRTWSQR